MKKRLLHDKLIGTLLILVTISTISVMAACGLKRYRLNYTASAGGRISGPAQQTVALGSSAEEVIALPDIGYRFVKWSDNDSTDPNRIDKNVTAKIDAIAIFEKQIFSVVYSTDGHGIIDGKASQKVAYGENAVTVEALPKAGFEFVRWSDGLLTAQRTDRGVTKNIYVKAEFAKIFLSADYIAATGGRIDGILHQSVAYGGYTLRVTAVPLPESGYIFDGWSDGVKEPSRRDLIKDAFSVTALFRKVYANGKGLPADPYLISDYQELTNMIYFPTSCYRLSCDLDLHDIDHIPMFDYDLPFGGVFDGGGHTVKNMRVDTDHQYPSLLGKTLFAIVKSLNITGFEIIVPNYQNSIFVGAVCGETDGTLENINVSGKITAEEIDYYNIAIGGLCGRANSVNNCHADIALKLNNVGSIKAGGLIGYSRGTEKAQKIDISSCSASGSIDVFSTEEENSNGGFIGGLIGSLYFYTTVQNDIVDIGVYVADSFSEVDITSNHQATCGGLIAETSVNTSLDITACYARGDITVKTGFAAGLIYKIDGSLRLIENCYTTGNTTADLAAGFIYDINAKVANITNCYVSGNVIAQRNSAGFCYRIYKISFYRCYVTGDVQGKNAAGFVFYWLFVEGIMEECFSTGVVKAVSPDTAAAGLVCYAAGTIKNCYSKNDIYLLGSKDPGGAPAVGGLVSVLTRTKMKNCYYSGSIFVLKQAFGDSCLIGAICADFTASPSLGGEIVNCHWLQTVEKEDCISYTSIGQNRHGTQTIETTAYNDISTMYFLADILNSAADDFVWYNLPNDTPQLKYMLKGGTPMKLE